MKDWVKETGICEIHGNWENYCETGKCPICEYDKINRTCPVCNKRIKYYPGNELLPYEYHCKFCGFVYQEHVGYLMSDCAEKYKKENEGKMHTQLKTDFDNLKEEFDTITTYVEYCDLREYLKLLKDLRESINDEIYVIKREVGAWGKECSIIKASGKEVK